MIDKAQEKGNIYNLGTDEYCEVNDSVGWICRHLNLSPRLTYSGGERGWIGDNTFIFLDTTHIRALGWKPLDAGRQPDFADLERGGDAIG